MKPRTTVITLGVDDLERSLAYLRDRWALKQSGGVGAEIEHRAVVFFELQLGLKLALDPRNSLALDSTLPLGAPSAAEFSIGHTVASKHEVDGVMEQARKAGTVMVKPAQDALWGGYAGYFQDRDQHLWEVACNPQWVDEEDA